MDTAILEFIIGLFTSALLLGWHWLVWRELSVKRQVLSQLARQVVFSSDAVSRARDGPCADSTRLALETDCAV